MLALWLTMVGCAGDGGALAGEWIAAFYRADDGVDEVPDDLALAGILPRDTGDTGLIELLPACEGDVGAESFRAWLRVDQTQPVSGEHLSLYPDGPDEERPEASNSTVPSSAMAGLVTGAWEDGQVQLDLVPDLDFATATDHDREAWRDHHLQLRSQIWGDRCWTAAWAWVDGQGAADPVEQGVVFVRRQ